MAAKQKPQQKTETKKKQQEVFTTAVGTLHFPYLTTPRDYDGNEQFYYDTGFLLEGAEASKLAEMVDAWMEASHEENPKLKLRDAPYGPALDKDKKEIPDKTNFRFKVQAEIETRKGKWDRKPKLFDAKGAPITGPISIGSGTQARIKYTVYYTKGGSKAGVMLQPIAIQIKKLVEGFTPPDVSFDQMEDGYEYVAPDGDAPAGGSDDGEF